MRAGHGPRTWLIAALVLLGHGLLWLGLNSGQRGTPTKPATELISLRLIAEPLRPAARPQARPQERPAATTPPRSSLALPAPSAIEASPAPPSTSTVEQAEAAPAASAPLPALLDSEATRRAIRQAARTAPLTAAAPAETSQQRLGREIGQSADGDCLKGEFAGSGMGLLSAPFWLLAEARGKCRR